MTKKFWNDWQKRVYETENIYLFLVYNETVRTTSNCALLSKSLGDKIVKAEFHNDAVDLVIERHTSAWKNGQIHQVIQNEYKTLHREEIAKIKFRNNMADMVTK